MTALRRMKLKSLGGLAAAVVLALGAPALAQDSDAPVDVTAGPPPSAETIGPSQLRDFNLQGTVTRPSDQPATTPAQPATTASAPPRSGEAVPTEATQATGGPSTARPAATRPALTSSAGPVSPGSGLAGEAPVTPSLPLEVTTNPAPQPSTDSGALTPPALDSQGGFLSLPWIVALIAAIGGGAFVVWSRRGRRHRNADPGRMAFAGLAPELEPETGPIPQARPRADPVPPRAQPETGPRPDPVPSPGPKAAPPPSNDGLVVSTRLKPQINVEFQPDRVMVTDQEVLLQFDVVLTNVGSAPARDVLVESRLFTAHAGQDRDIGMFFQNPATGGDRMSSIAPLARISLKSVARLPIDEVHHFEAAGRKLFVPMVGLNILYRFGSDDGLASASFLVGRGGEEDEKLAPFRIDLGPRIFRGLSARPHSLGLQQVA